MVAITKFGVYPMDFILESVLKAGLQWFQANPTEASTLVFGQLDQPYLARYGTAKITELKNYILTTDIKIVQSLRLVDNSVPHISLQLGSGSEDLQKASIDDSIGDNYILDSQGALMETEEVGYSPITESVLIGLHTGNTPDLPKYLYMLVVYILNSYKYDLMQKGIYLGTFSMTDISRMNDYLSENIYSRFMTFTASYNAPWKKGALPQLDVVLDPSFVDNGNANVTKI